MEKLGINSIYLIAQIVNFGIILFFLKKFLYKPFLKILDERKKKVEEGVRYRQKMEKELGEIKVKEEELLSKARKESQKIIEEARKSAEKIEKEMIEKAKLEAIEVIKQSKASIEGERKKAIQDIENQAVDLVAATTKCILEDILDTKQQHEIIQQAISNLKDNDTFKFV